MEARRQELLNEEDGYWRQRMDQQQLVEKLKAEVAEQEELKGHSEVSALGAPASASIPAVLMLNSVNSALTSGCVPAALTWRSMSSVPSSGSITARAHIF